MIKTLTEEQAKEQGYRCLTRPYRPSQEHMWRKVVADMKRGNIECCLVSKVVSYGEDGNFKGVSVWRK